MRRSVLFTWLFSYLCILFLPVTISLIVNSQFNSTLRDEIHRANDSLLRQIQKEIDNHFANIARLGNELYFNPKLQDLSNTRTVDSFYYYDLYQMSQNLISYKTSTPFLDQLYIYLKNRHTVLLPGTGRPVEFAFETLHGNTGISYEQWLAIMEQRHSQSYLRIPRIGDNGQQHAAVAYISSMPLNITEPPLATIVLMVDESKLLDIVNNIQLFNGGRVLILNEQMQPLVSSDPVETGNPLPYERMTENSGMLYTTYKGMKAEAFYLKSKNGQLTYVSEIPSRLYWEKAEYVRNLMYISILASLLGGGLLTLFFIRRNYNPLHQLIQSFQGKDGVPSAPGNNEFRYIQRVMDRMIGEQEKNNRIVRQQHGVLRDNVLVRLMKGQWDSQISLEEAMDAFHIRFDSDNFAVLLFYFEDAESFFERLDNMDAHAKWKLMRFIVVNVLEDTLRPAHQGYAVEIDEAIVLLVNLMPGDEAWMKQELRDIAEKAKQFLAQNFRIESTLSVSSVLRSTYNISQAYREALNAMEYKLVRGSRNIISYDDVRQDVLQGQSMDYYYPLHVEKQWINVVRAGDFETANQMLHEIIERNMAGPTLSVHLMRCLMFDLVGTLLKTVREMGSLQETLITNSEAPLDKLLACETIQDMMQQLTLALKEICAYARSKHIEQAKAKRHSEMQQLADRVIAYIQHNYADGNLNISMIGHEFGMKPSYLSKLFKELTGVPLLDFINQVRIEQAKQLLHRQDVNMNEVSSLVGFNDVTVLFRLFKKYEGITPGQYKESRKAP